ncbi:hypothetical protein KZX46_18540 [Polymorphobacter sp. PAMC 29334]|uniref:hypothetical protein n=1 Tax=Polymorphobacter sp. PAMC 29334 TaxID=2862331 RepID=UPI001C7905AB|nr:hypothetical protein [Polymorphobacter sp. PAMC 29334]QYE34725.1 hypothetical protein KZX46_18540 [Polymorphobacter sp. PAMC 29334]
MLLSTASIGEGGRERAIVDEAGKLFWVEAIIFLIIDLPVGDWNRKIIRSANLVVTEAIAICPGRCRVDEALGRNTRA